jgi:hypothetical protein
MSLYSKQQIFCNCCGKECFTELPGGMMGGGRTFVYLVCTVECLREMRRRETNSILGKEYISWSK